MSAEIVNAMKTYIDELGCIIHTKRTFGRSKKGERANRKIASQSAAIGAELGMVYYQYTLER